MGNLLIFLTLTLLFGYSSSLKCYNGSFEEVTNFMAFKAPEIIDCSGFCVTQYQNDGQTLNYTLRCDDSTKYCTINNQCKDDYGTSTKTCCCNTDLCVHENATKPIIYNLSLITFSSATAAYQVEGGAWDHRGPSIWDTYSHLPNKIHHNDTGDDACKSYYKWQEDIKLLKSLNVQQYRFSISWSRIFIDGTNATINDIGVKYYSDLIDALRAANIEPVITMFHWDLPQSLMDLGGWLNADTAVKFGEYARYIFQKFGTRVKKWIPINEPLSVAQGEFCGDNGSGAPGEFAPHCAWSLYLAAKNLLLAHMEAWKAFQDLGLNKDGGILGMALNGPWFFPANLSNSDDIEASARAFDFYWGLFGHPLFLGDWAPRVKERIAELSKKKIELVQDCLLLHQNKFKH
jgi:beta-glucosidase/6-phospho-beta-glucosidase/beta-galactosidase